MRTHVRLLWAALVFTAAIAMSHGAALARATDQAVPDLESAIRLYALPRGFVFRGECAAVPSSVTTGLCYEASIRADGDAAVLLTNLSSGDSAVLLFADGNPGWYPFTRSLVVTGESPGINTLAQWSDVAGSWTANGVLTGTGYIGVGSVAIQSDGSGSVGAGRFDVARLQLSALQDGIAVGTLTVVRDNFDPRTQAFISVTDLGSAPCAVVVLNDGRIILTSVIYGENWLFIRQP